MLAKSSLPVQGAWIEMSMNSHMRGEFRRSPCRERGLKSLLVDGFELAVGRSPCRERGLKFFTATPVCATRCMSLPVQGAWIEITT